MQNKDKLRVLWLAFKLLDKSENRIVLFEMLKHIGIEFDARLMAGYRDEPVPAVIAGHPIQYYNRSGNLPFNIIRAFFSQHRLIQRMLCDSPVDLVFLSHGPSLYMMRKVFRYAQRAKASIIFDVRTLPSTDIASRDFKLFGQKLFFAAKNFAGITYITEEMRRYCMERYQLPDHCSTVWTSGVDTELFTTGCPSPTNGPFHLIYHGGIISVNRGLDRLIQAMDRVRDIDIHLSLVSSLREPEVVAWIDRLNLWGKVKLIDTIPHAKVPAMIRNHHAGILPFPNYDIWNTSSPIKLFEYMASGLPVVVTGIPAHRNVLEGKPFAFFAKDATPEALAEAIRKIYSSRDRLSDLGVLARQQVVEHHTWSSQAEILGAFLKKMIR